MLIIDMSFPLGVPRGFIIDHSHCGRTLNVLKSLKYACVELCGCVHTLTHMSVCTYKSPKLALGVFLHCSLSY